MAAVTQAMQASAEEVGHKVFVGNMAFSLSEEDVKNHFGTIGKVIDTQIIRRGNRSLGYGFVAYEKEADAVKAISQFDKTEINGRVVNVELAKPAPTNHAAEASVPEQAAQAAAEGGSRGRRQGRLRGRGRGRPRGRRPQNDGEADVGVESVTTGLAIATIVGSAPTTNGRGKGRPRRTGPPTGEPSKTLVFVANLPFNIDDEGLKGIFTGYNIASAHVVTRKYGPVAGKSKGFGFVDFASEADQQKALTEINGKEIDGRSVQVKVAIQSDQAEAEATGE